MKLKKTLVKTIFDQNSELDKCDQFIELPTMEQIYQSFLHVNHLVSYQTVSLLNGNSVKVI